MSVNQAPITADALNDLEALCQWLNDQPSHASYFPQGQPYLCTEPYTDLRDGVVFWSAGHGWRLHTNWRAALAAKRTALG